jgi:hypothetical protein
MTNVQPVDLRNATVVLACAMGLAVVSAAPVEAQTSSSHEGECIVEVMSFQEGAEVVIEPDVLDLQRTERANRLSRKFKQLAREWRNERGSMSSINGMSMLPSYQSIVGMGPEALPLILAELRGEGDDPDQWFWALISISKAADLNPPQITPEDQGNFRRMAQAWLKWGEAQGYAG